VEDEDPKSKKNVMVGGRGFVEIAIACARPSSFTRGYL
jgi:hypothetical protein